MNDKFAFIIMSIMSSCVNGLRDGSVVQISIVSELVSETKFYVKLLMFDFYVLIEGSFWAIRALASFYWTSVMSLDFVGSPPESFLSIIFQFLSLLYLLAFLFQFAEPGRKLIAFIEELAHLS